MHGYEAATVDSLKPLLYIHIGAREYTHSDLPRRPCSDRTSVSVQRHPQSPTKLGGEGGEDEMLVGKEGGGGSCQGGGYPRPALDPRT